MRGVVDARQRGPVRARRVVRSGRPAGGFLAGQPARAGPRKVVVLQEPHHTLAVERLAAPRQLVSAAGRASGGAVKACDRAAAVGEAIVAADPAQGDVREVARDQQPRGGHPRSPNVRMSRALMKRVSSFAQRVIALARGALGAKRQTSATSAVLVTAKNAARIVIACSRCMSLAGRCWMLDPLEGAEPCQVRRC